MKIEKLLVNSPEVVEICLNCPYKRCIDNFGKGCDRYREEFRKIEEKYNAKARKSDNCSVD